MNKGKGRTRRKFTDKQLFHLLIDKKMTEKAVAKELCVALSSVSRRALRLGISKKEMKKSIQKKADIIAVKESVKSFLIDQDNLKRFNRILTNSLTIAEKDTNDYEQFRIQLEHIARMIDVDGQIIDRSKANRQRMKETIERILGYGRSPYKYLQVQLEVVKVCLPAIKYYEEFVERITKAEGIAIILNIIKEQIAFVAPEIADEIGRRLHAYLRFGTRNKPIELIERENKERERKAAENKLQDQQNDEDKKI